MKKVKKQRPDINVLVDCPCGMKHLLLLGLGELQVMQRQIVTGKGSSLKVRHVIFAPTGKINGHGQPDYQVFKPEGAS